MWNMAEKVLFLGIGKRNSGGKPDLVRFHVDLEFICGFCEGEVLRWEDGEWFWRKRALTRTETTLFIDIE